MKNIVVGLGLFLSSTVYASEHVEIELFRFQQELSQLQKALEHTEERIADHEELHVFICNGIERSFQILGDVRMKRPNGKERKPLGEVSSAQILDEYRIYQNTLQVVAQRELCEEKLKQYERQRLSLLKDMDAVSRYIVRLQEASMRQTILEFSKIDIS